MRRKRSISWTCRSRGPWRRAAESVERWSFLEHLYAAAAFAVVFVRALLRNLSGRRMGHRAGDLPGPGERLAGHEGTAPSRPIPRRRWARLCSARASPRRSISTRGRPPRAAGYDAASSGGTNLGPLSDKLLNGIHDSKNADGTPNPAADFDGIKDLVAAYRTENGLADDAIVPADAVTRSASGLDPHISPENARLQAGRVARARSLSDDAIRRLIVEHTDAPSLGILGEAGVNVLLLNLALDRGAR